MKLKSVIYIMTFLLFGLAVNTKADNYRVLHHFAGGANDGSGGYGALIQSGPSLYGMTWGGGSYNLGTIFKIDADDANFGLLRSFSGGATDGQSPIGSLLLSGTTLYGMASCENTSYGGTVFKLNIDGSEFQVLRSFAVSDGTWPYGSLIQSDLTLYGFNTYGGSASGWNGKGTVFKINTDGTGFQKLRTFAGGSSDGDAPHGSPILSGSTLYGTTLYGGSSNLGTVFKINTDGSGFQILRSFIGGSNDGASPYMVTLVQSGTTFYGTTVGGGTSNKGTVFKINTNGTEFQLLHSFTNESGGDGPLSSLVLSGSKLYGTTHYGGASNLGTVFALNTDGTGFQLLHSFNGANGSKPFSSLLLSGVTLYGTTSEGGSSNLGVIFALDVPVTCVEPPEGDLNGDCKVDFEDFAIMADEWLDCGLEPPEACTHNW
jgi:uncharacterized repeat protein (TIGR03803 family)